MERLKCRALADRYIRIIEYEKDFRGPVVMFSCQPAFALEGDYTHEKYSSSKRER